VTYFHFGFFGQSLLIRRHAGSGTKTHAPVAMDTDADFPATVIAVQRRDSDEKLALGREFGRCTNRRGTHKTGSKEPPPVQRKNAKLLRTFHQ
jgi:hypothetical protein